MLVCSKRAYWLDETGIPILRATRTWIQYGTVGFAVICIFIGAVEGTARAIDHKYFILLYIGRKDENLVATW